jgi:uncharacterized membrane protein YccC
MSDPTQQSAGRLMEEWLSSVSSIPSALKNELALLSLRGPRARESVKASLSVMLAVVLAKAFGLDDIWWAAFSGYMVMRSRFDESFRRGVFRVGGTALGAAIGICIAAAATSNPVILVSSTFLIASLTIYNALVSRYSYAWLLAGITNVMVLAFAALTPTHVSHFALLRIADVAAGTVACLVVSVLFELARPSQPDVFYQSFHSLAGTPGAAIAAATMQTMRRRLLRHACEGALAVVCVASLGCWLKMHSFAQASITIFAVMVVPFSDFAEDRYTAVTQKMIHRVIGCLCGGLVGILMLLLTGKTPALWWLALPVGVWIGQHIQDGEGTIGYFGTQFCLGYLTAFVHDPHVQTSYLPPAERLLGILTGLLFLGVILSVSAWVRFPKRAH